jgi:dihydroxyacetone kinase-like protein
MPTPPDIPSLIRSVASRVIDHADELTELDAAIGDADHGINMKRGFEAILADLSAYSGKPLPDALKAVGTTLVMTVGGASGPLYGTLFLALGKALPANPSAADVGPALVAAGEAVKARGKSETGSKTMLDVLVPVAAHIASGAADLSTIRQLATRCAQDTVPMRARRGRASFLGERSIGHMDPGARSCELLIHAICDSLVGTP